MKKRGQFRFAADPIYGAKIRNEKFKIFNYFLFCIFLPLDGALFCSQDTFLNTATHAIHSSISAFQDPSHFWRDLILNGQSKNHMNMSFLRL